MGVVVVVSGVALLAGWFLASRPAFLSVMPVAAVGTPRASLAPVLPLPMVLMLVLAHRLSPIRFKLPKIR
jgi:hypothetical protein